ncbi:hypothetical protein Taro_053046 [Colocasia esculenta]|uniref:Helicase ATP-binding domain-containing protein n=1 Tax=Colocasia esculenta TaxID=4460 RepID=A0A843XLF0_COLES|nr:hypothetical protein [Colocasia esculenta]
MGEAPAMAKQRREFPAFPFEPYPIQVDFMAALYESLDKGGVAMLESPTGTGKTLSIICSALQWIVDQRQRPKTGRKLEEARAGDSAEDEPDWMRDFVVDAEQSLPSRKKERKQGIAAGPSVPTRNRDNLQKGEVGSSDNAVEFDETEFLVEEYMSEEEDMLGTGRSTRKRGAHSGCSSSSGEEEDEGSERPGGEIEVTPKVYFSSRTHSQLTQFVGELKRTKFASELNAVCLGSRKNLCINEGVLKLGNSTRINERCLELQKNRKDKNAKQSRPKVSQSGGGRTNRAKTSGGCPMLKKQSLQTKFRDEVLEQDILDIEDLVDLGRKIGTCPYYGSRKMVSTADLVVLPYQSLLLKSARESLGLNLKNNVIIIDEAHNLADSLVNMYNAKITVSQLEHVQSNLDVYLGRFRTCLGAGNRRYIQTLVILTKAFLSMLLRNENDARNSNSCSTDKFSEMEKDSSMTINEFLFALDIDNINLVKLCRYIKESNIIHKVSGYGAKIASLPALPGHDGQSNIQEGTIVASFQALSDLLFSLTYNDDDGRIIVSRQGHLHPGQFEEGYLKFVMLSGDSIFSEVMDQAHAVVLAGGTLQPIEETRLRLFPGIPLDKVNFFSCNHIVPPESILPIAVCRGPSGLTFDFTYTSRCSTNMMEELGRLVCNLVAVVPEGVVMFFSSFEYEGQVYQAWKTSGILARILKKKTVFREPRSSLDVESTLKEYKEAINQCSSVAGDNRGPCGALLLAVVGGKISEGINFSDGMGRCVVMVGLPYPNPRDVELMERIKHIDGLGEPGSSRRSKSLGNMAYGQSTVQPGFEILRSCKQRGREYYGNLCMKAVNQSVGRAIRHIKDYAAILLVDSRYASEPSKPSLPRPTDKLPLWIKGRLVFATESYGEVHRQLHQFFQFNRQRTH